MEVVAVELPADVVAAEANRDTASASCRAASRARRPPRRARRADRGTAGAAPLPAAPSCLAACLAELRHHARGSIGYTAKRAPPACPHRGQAEPPAGGAPRGSGRRESMSGYGSRTSSLAAMPAHGVDPAYRNSAPGSTLLVAVEQQKSSTCSCGRRSKNSMC